MVLVQTKRHVALLVLTRRYVGTDGIYSLSSQYQQNSDCPVCSPALDLHVAPTDTLMQVIDAMRAHPSLGPLLSEPSVSAGSVNLYMRGALEAELRDNLNQVGGEGPGRRKVFLFTYLATHKPLFLPRLTGNSSARAGHVALPHCQRPEASSTSQGESTLLTVHEETWLG